MIQKTKHDKDITLERIHKAVDVHPRMPAMLKDLMAHANDPELDFKQLADSVRFDPGITMNILKAVNSAAFSGSQRIDSLQQAFVRLGSKRLFRIIMAQGLASHLAMKLDGYDLEPHTLLKHSIGVALTAETLALSLGRHPKEMLFTAGLVHDMGKIVLDPFVQENRREFDAQLRDSDAAFDQIEINILGVSHPQAGAWLMEKWAFPEELIAIVNHHHHPNLATEYRETALMVHLADTLVYSLGVGDGIDGFRYIVTEDGAVRLGLRSQDIEQVASITLEKMNEWDSIIQPECDKT